MLILSPSENKCTIYLVVSTQMPSGFVLKEHPQVSPGPLARLFWVILTGHVNEQKLWLYLWGFSSKAECCMDPLLISVVFCLSLHFWVRHTKDLKNKHGMICRFTQNLINLHSVCIGFYDTTVLEWDWAADSCNSCFLMGYSEILIHTNNIFE